MKNTIYFDMDGTIANFYGVDGWLNDLMSGNSRPYRIAAPLIQMVVFSALLNTLQRKGYKIGVVSWLAKNSTERFDREVINAKKEWLNTHLNNVTFDEIHIVKYGTPKSTVVNNPHGILFDDEEQNRKEWLGTAYDVNNIIDTLRAIA